MTSPLILDAESLKALRPPVLPISQMASASPLASVPAPSMPQVSVAPNPLTQRLQTDQGELKRLQDTGSGVGQISNPFLRGAARIGDTALSILAPHAASLIGGTTGHNLLLQQQAQGRIGEDQGEQQKQAQLTLLDAQPQLKQQALENQTLKTQGLIQHQADMLDLGQQKAKLTYDANLRNHGYAPDETDPTGQKVRPLRYEEMSENQQAVEDLKHSQAEYAEANAALKKAQNDPTSPAFRLAKERVDVAVRNSGTAAAKLGLQAQGLDLRRQTLNANLYGTDMQGNALPGSAQITGDDGQSTTVGARFAGNAIKQQKTVGTFNDLTGSVGHLRNAIKAYEAEGGDMSDARLAQAASDPHSVVGKVINGKLVTNGLSPAAITLLNAQRQTMEQAGILRSTTGGTASEAGAQRILAVVPQFGADTNKSAYSKLDEQQEVLNRLTPGMTHVGGGLTVHGQHGKAGPPSYKQTATGPANHKIGSNDGGNTWFDVQTGKAVQ